MYTLIFRLLTVIFLFSYMRLCLTEPSTQATLRRSIESPCSWGDWGEFGDCINGLMSRVRPCVCDNVLSPPKLCPAGVSFSETVHCQDLGNGLATEEGTKQDFMLETGANDEVSLVEVDEVGSPSNVTVGGSQEGLSFCGWKWSRWSECTQECGLSPTGNTTRTQQCWCIGMMNPEDNETMCKDHPKWTETVPCNDFPCNGIRPQNKIVWTELYQSAQMWPLPSDQKFPCSRGDQYQFSNKSWGEVLEDPLYEENLSWHFLAKEYITGRLNKAQGSPTSPETNQALEDAQYLLSKCDGYDSNDNLRAYITKEKLSRSNNGIGGLSNVDTQMGLVYGGGDSGSNNGAIVILPDTHNILIGVVVFLVVLGVGIFVVYRIRQRNVEVIENERYSNSDEENHEDERESTL